jgi:hypothetical protein
MFHANDTVYCRFTGEAFTVIYCNGCVVKLDDNTVRPVGELTLFRPRN